MKDFRGKKALVTGAASGIGRAIATALAREGADLFLIDIDAEGLAETARLAEAQGVRAITHQCDLGKGEAVAAAAQAVLSAWGRLNILVNNAGVAYYGATHNMSAAQWDWLMGVNLMAPIQLVRELLPTLCAQDEAHILNVCSVAGLVATRKMTAYHASKFGLVGFTEALRAEYGRRGLGVSALCPGFVRTRMMETIVNGRPDKPVPLPPRWMWTSADRVASRAVWAIRRNRGLVLVTPMARMLWLFKRLSPRFVDWLNREGWRRKRRLRGEEAAMPADATAVGRPASGTE